MSEVNIDRAIASANPYPDEDIVLPSREITDELISYIAHGPGPISPESDIPAGSTRLPIFRKPHEQPAGQVSALTRRHRKPARRTLRTALGAAAVLLLSAAAWGAILTARTGMFGEPGSEEGGGEMIRIDAPDAGPVIDQLAAGIPLPPGTSFEEWKSKNLKASGDGPGVLMSETAVRSTLSYVAACHWTGYWLEAHERSDGRAMRRAQKVLDEIPRWKALVESDADGGLVSSLENRAKGARLNQPSMFFSEYKINCTDDHPPPAG